ncbi:DNA-binding CsgD family transcriptional regulator [Actinoplanes tereljensis]|uniref:helix-turn-helix transcriptional regulator n=1 Tax=Paractinoplanes tereljensis TaxID=571912 RepID=UPI001941D9A6|nr:LuxR family transcriptional regulator [Actinoplanes tereljensis]
MAELLSGRDTELAQLHDLLAGLPDRGGALVVRGGAGVGKSALLTAAAARATATGVQVLRTSGVQSEFDVPYSGLPASLGLLAEEATTPYQVALAMVGKLAAGPPILLVIDDAQWLDRSSWDVLIFAGRRLDADAVVMLLGVRDGEEVDARLARTGLRELAVGPLAEADAAGLLDARAPALVADLRARVLAEAAGNPLGLLELAGVAARLGEQGLLPGWLPLSTRLERAFGDLVAGLPARTRSLLLVAAFNDSDGLDEMLGAGPAVEVADAAVDDVQPAISAGVLEVDDARRVRFRHPLLRSAVRQSSSLSQRARAHAALAGVVGDPDRRVWHRAAATFDRDEDLAGQLVELARRALRRGAAATAMAAWERAAQLTEPGPDRAARLVSAAWAASETHDQPTLVRLLATAEEQEMRATDRTQAAWLREVYGSLSWSGSSRLLASVEIAEQAARDGDPELALDMLVQVSFRSAWSNPDDTIRQAFVAAAERLDRPPLEPRLVAVLAIVEPIERGELVLARLAELSTRIGLDPGHLHELGTGAGTVGALDLAALFLAGSVEALRDQGRLVLLAQALVTQAWNAAWMGDTVLGLTAATEAGVLATETGQPLWALVAGLAQAHVAALRGDPATTKTLTEQGERVLMSVGAHPQLSLVMQVRGVAALGTGRYEEAFDHLSRIFDPADIAYHPYVRFVSLAPLVDAAVHCGRHDAVRVVVEEMKPIAARSGSPALRVGLAYAAAMLAADDEAEELFRSALSGDPPGWPFERARLQLGFGAWLRRQRRKADSRAHLRAAMAAFDAVGAGPWAEFARRELRASGETVRRADDARDRLTPQEVQIAQLAAQGLSNREIGGRLFLSPRTVSTHLYRIYPKLGVSSRAELASLYVN